MSERPTSPPAAAPRPGSVDAQTRVLLAMLHSARSRDDRDEAERLWLLMVVAEMERVRAIAGAYRHHALPGGRIPRAEIDDVAQEVFLRLHGKIDTLRGRSVGELRKFMSTATGFACLDFMERHVRDDQRRGVALDDDGGPDGSSRAEDALSRLAAELAADDEAAEIAREVIHPALGLVDPDKRAVLVMDQKGYTVAEIMERLGLSRDNVYQRRQRGLLQLQDAIRELSGEDGGA